MSTERRALVVTRGFEPRPIGSGRRGPIPTNVKRWWGPHGFTAPVAKMHVREGGTSLVSMRSPEGQALYNTWTYQEVVAGKRLVYVLRFADQDGNAIDPAEQGLPAETPREIRNEVVFNDLVVRTGITVTEYDWPAGQMMEMSRMGLEQTLDKMAAVLASSRNGASEGG